MKKIYYELYLSMLIPSFFARSGRYFKCESIAKHFPELKIPKNEKKKIPLF